MVDQQKRLFFFRGFSPARYTTTWNLDMPLPRPMYVRHRTCLKTDKKKNDKNK